MKYYLWVLGCAMNQSDAERISSVLDLSGYKKTDSEAEADLIIVVACSVRQTAIDRIYGKAKSWQKLKIKNCKFKIVLTGCVLDKDKKKMSEIFDYVLTIEEIGKLPSILKYKYEYLNSKQNFNNKIINSTLNKNLKFKIKNYVDDYFALDAKYESTFRAYVPIMTGCDNFCSYCAVPYTRGREKSRSQADILKEIKALVKKGYKEITLLGQNVNSYNDKGRTFVMLIREIDKIPGNWRGYFYSNHPKDMSDELIKILPKLKHFPAYIHLPLQSGNDRILSEMNRHYTKKDYLALVAKIRKVMPDVVLTTDIIVGYPGEGRREFQDTLDVVKKAKFEMIFIGKYSPRAGTRSYLQKDDVSSSTKSEREKILTELLAENLLNVNKRLIGKTIKVLLDEKKSNNYYGRTEGYKVVELRQNFKYKIKKIEIGQFYQVKITDVGSWKLFGTIQDL